MPSSNPENIDVTLSLLDAGAMKDFVSQITEANTVLSSIKNEMKGMGSQAGEPSVDSSPSLPPQPLPWSPKSTANSMDAVQMPVPIPSVNDFTPQDIYPVASQIMDPTNSPAPQTQPGMLSAFASRVVPGKIQSLVGNVWDDEGALRKDNITQAALLSAGTALGQPLQNAFSTGTSVLNPFSAQSYGESSGLPGGPTVGPFQLPFGQATLQRYGDVANSVISGVGTPGVGSGEVMALGQTLNAEGWGLGSSDYNRLKDQATYLQSANFEQGKLSGLPASSMVSSMDQMSRYGMASQAQMEQTFTGLADAARGARMSLEEFNSGLDSAAEGLQQSGLTFAEGRQAALDFSATTNMPPQAMSQIMGNPMFQGMMMGQYGLPVEAQGLIAKSPGAFNAMTSQTVHMMHNTLKGMGQTQKIKMPGFTKTIPANRVEDQIAASTLGMDVEQYRNYLTQGHTSELQGNITDMTKNYDANVQKIHKQYAAGSPEFDRHMEQLRMGTGQYKGADTASWMDIMKQVKKGDAGFSGEQIARLKNSTASQRKGLLTGMISGNAPPRTSDNPNAHVIKFTGLAEKMLKEVLPNGGVNEIASARKAANRGAGALTDFYTHDQPGDLSGLLDAANAPQSQIDMANQVQDYQDWKNTTVVPGMENVQGYDGHMAPAPPNPESP